VSQASIADYEQEMVEQLLEYVHDPLRCVMFSYPWGEGELTGEPGPRNFQKRFLTELGNWLKDPATRYKPFRKAVASGHGIGKSALIGQIAHWAKSTFPGAKVLITANTGDQLKTKTQPEVAKWFRLASNKAWFDVHIQSIKTNSADLEGAWRTDFNTWSEDNPQAFAGAHNKGKRLVIIFDEASEISDVIWKTVEGALTDANTEIIWIAFSQATRSDGAFYEAVFGDQRHRWHPEAIDSRDVEGTNVDEINESIAIYGPDSDHVRVRYLGLFPLAGGGKFIDFQLVKGAQERPAAALRDEPLIAGVDFAWGGSDDNVIRFRKGFDARTIPAIKIKGEKTRDAAIMIGQLSDVLARSYNGEKVTMMFVDGSGVGGNAGQVVAGLYNLGYNDRVMEINFGHDAIDQQHYAYRRDEMWGKLKAWLAKGAIDRDIGLGADLQKPILTSDRLQRVKLEPKDLMKKRLAKMGLDSSSPDDADALALTFAMPVAIRKPATKQRPRSSPGAWS
jgi:hypothetical protein